MSKEIIVLKTEEFSGMIYNRNFCEGAMAMNGKLGKNFKKIILVESIVLACALGLFRVFLFPVLSRGGMMHLAMSMHIFMVGLMVTIFTTLTVFFKRGFKDKKYLIAMPAIFTIFGYLLIIMANGMNI